MITRQDRLRKTLWTVGESMIRFSAPDHSLLIDTPTVDIHVAGTESNVATAVARMGHRAVWQSRLTANALGKRITQTLAGYGVDCSQVVWTDQDRVGTYYLETGASPRPTQVLYDRQHSAASRMDEDTFGLTPLREASIVHLTGITPALSAGCLRLVQRVIETARANNVPVSFDVNYRAKLWSAQACRETLTPMLRQVQTLLISKRDAEGVFGIVGDPVSTLHQLRERFGVGNIAVTVGEDGAVGLSGDAVITVPGFKVQMVDRIGAGDSFAAGVICGLLEGDDFALGVRYGVAMSALQLTLAGDLFRLDREDVLRLMNSGASLSLMR